MIKTLKIIIGLLACLTFIMCNKSNDPTSFKLGEAFLISFEEESNIDDLTISFIDVVEESRCPSFALCTWPGQVIISLNLNNQNFKLSPFHHDNSNSRKDTLGNYIYTLKDVTPYPGLAGSRIIKEDYQIELLVEEL